VNAEQEAVVRAEFAHPLRFQLPTTTCLLADLFICPRACLPICQVEIASWNRA